MVAITPTVAITTYLLYFFFSNPNSHLCTSDDRTVRCSNTRQTVCALVEGRNSTSQIKNYYETTFTNGCSACTNSDVIGYIPGACSSSVQVCTKNPKKVACSRTRNNVCSFIQNGTGCDLEVVAQTELNSCHGCDADGSKFFAHGNCNNLNAQVCDSSQRCGGICPFFATDICVYYGGDSCSEALCRKSAQSNGCLECADPDTLFYVNGACS